MALYDPFNWQDQAGRPIAYAGHDGTHPGCPLCHLAAGMASDLPPVIIGADGIPLPEVAEFTENPPYPRSEEYLSR